MNWFHDTARRFQMQFYTAVKINYFQPYYTKKKLYSRNGELNLDCFAVEKNTIHVIDDMTIASSIKHCAFLYISCLNVKIAHRIAERRVLELIPGLSSQPGGDVSHKPGGRLPITFHQACSYPRNP